MDKVLCIISREYETIAAEEGWLDLDSGCSTFTEKLIPVYDVLHNDIESGQDEFHYHVDTRYTNEHILSYRVALPLPDDSWMGYRQLSKIRETEKYSTGEHLIHKAKLKLKHKCIHKGKCPHKGYNLNKVKPIDGIITCPLHNLKFNEITKLLIKD